jgi:hypothetical protein
MRSARKMFLGLGTAAVLSVLLSATAFADAKVVVELKDAAGKPAEGEVSLYKKTGEKIATCKTTGGKCDMSGVAGGNYEVRVVPEKGAAPKPRSAMIPPEGTATLIVSTGS